MATLDTTGVIAYMFDQDVVITQDAKTFALYAGQIMGSPDNEASVTVDVAATAACMTDSASTSSIYNALPVFMKNELRTAS